MSPEVREVLHRAAVEDHSGPDTDAILTRAGRLRARRRLAGVGAAVLVPLTILAAVVLSERVDVTLVDRAPATVLEVPSAQEQVAAAFLEDGTPVFVIDHGQDEISVLDARVPYAPLGQQIDLLVGWCPTSARFQEPRFGSEFAPDGAHLNGPAPAGLVPYRTESLEGRRVRVGERGTPPPRRQAPVNSTPSGAECDFADAGRGHGLWHHADRTAHAPSPREAVARRAAGPVVAWGTLEYVGEMPPRLCDHSGVTDRDGAGPQCDSQPLDTELPPLPGDTDPDRIQGFQGVMAIAVVDGKVAGVTLTAGVRRYGMWSADEKVVDLPHLPVPNDEGVRMEAAIDGTLRADPDTGCVWLERDDGRPLALVWYDQLRVRFPEDGPAQVEDREGTVYAVEGETAELGGGGVLKPAERCDLGQDGYFWAYFPKDWPSTS